MGFVDNSNATANMQSLKELKAQTVLLKEQNELLKQQVTQAWETNRLLRTLIANRSSL